MTKNRARRQAGLTFIEMLIAMTLLALILLAIAPLFIMSVKSNYAGNEYTSIHNLARDRLEQLMNLPVTDPQLAAPGVAPTNYIDLLPPTLPDPATGIPPSNMRNTLSRSYTVQRFISTAPVGTGSPWILTPANAGQPYEFKQIDVTVTSSSFGTASGLGLGQRTARVTGFLRNTDPVGNPN